MQTTDLPACPALDMAVAMVCGWHYDHSGLTGNRKPSSDISDAFEALEVAIKQGRELTIEFYEGEWLVGLRGAKHRDILAKGDTPALAICRAIIATGANHE